MQDILKLQTALELTDWTNRGLTHSVSDDPVTGKNRIALMGGFDHIDFNNNKLGVYVVIYNLDDNGKPLNGRLSKADGSIYPKEILIQANNETFVSLPGLTVIPNEDVTDDMRNNVDYGNGYMREFDAYFAVAQAGAINLFDLIRNAIDTSSQV